MAMKQIFIHLFFVSLLVCGCTSKTDSSSNEEKTKTQNEIVVKIKDDVKKTTLQIYAYGDFPETMVTFLQSKLAEVFGNVKIKGHLDFPDDAWYAPRQRYRAPKLLAYQKTLFTCNGQEKSNSEYILGLTTKDISLKYKEHEDWGVMGLSSLNQRVSVISTFRLGGVQKMNKDSFCKLALHELGHAAGLPHCDKSKTCIMRDANGKDHFPQLTDFCPSCKSYLQEQGWNLQ